MSRDRSLPLLLRVREARERAMRMRVTHSLAEQHAAEDRLQWSEDELQELMLPSSATLSTFLATAAARNTMAREVVSLRGRLECAVTATEEARREWLAADRDRDGAQRLVDRAAALREGERLHVEQRETDDLSQSRTTGTGAAPEGDAR